MKALFLKLWAKLGPWVHRLLSEDNGNPSSMRLIMVGWHGIVALVWATLSIHGGTMVPLDPSIVETLGMTIAGKFGQKFGETKVDPQS